jgi:hypothetical protein
MGKYFLSRNVMRPVVVDDHTFNIEPAVFFEASSSYWGAIEATDEKDIQALEKAVAGGLIEEITKADFDIYELKKKQRPLSSTVVHLKPSLSPQNAIMTGRPAQVVEEAPAKSADASAAPETLDEILNAK